MRFAATLVVVLSSAAALAGPLAPPAGPVAPTHKTLTEVEPRTPISAATTPGDANSLFRITQPGSYYLTGNITGVAGFRGIEIAAPDVTIDLNGYTLTGVAGSLQGIATDGTYSGIVIHGGSVNAWGSSGVDLVQGGSGNQHRVEDVRATFNGNHGISVGIQSIVRGCISRSNAGNGFNAPSIVRFEGCTARFNSARGFFTQGLCLFNDCSALQNTGAGFFIWGECILTSCIASLNGGHGFETNSHNSFIGCTAAANDGNGLSLDDHCSVLDCIVRGNGAIGILAVTGGTIARCTIADNGHHGVSVSANAHLTGNSCVNNGTTLAGAGIHLTSGDNRVEENNLALNDWGMLVAAAGNFIARNTASGNTTANWEVVANNKCHVVLGVNSAAISGDSGGVSQGSTNPNANYSY